MNPSAQEIRPTFRVVFKKDAKFKRKVVSRLNGKFEFKEVDDKGYWQIFFPNGSSLRITDKKELERLGFDRPAALVNMETGDVVGNMQQFQIGSDDGDE